MKIADLFKVEGYGAIVTGGASGLGLGFVEAMAENGARVTMLDVNEETIGKEVERLRGEGFDVDGKVVDVRDHAALDAAFEEVVQKYGRLDVTFANAGIDSGPGFVEGWVGERTRNDAGAIENYEDERWQRVIDINLTGAFATVRAAARHMKPRKFGRIIATTSMAATHTEPAIGVAYMTAKAGLAHFVRNTGLELAAYNITVNAIAPGFFITNIGGGHAHNPDLQKLVSKYIPMHRVGFPDDMKGLALFLASPASAYITGQQIGIDGGWSLGAAD
ncbi:MAG TPA: SDR family NAD(P)-dependent oxidoreductase [Alphaproteobacteria bacterium]|nr:SDR family NAD(P)-dependent oxidoreductase [Alphaproteobacteria bacterium]